MNTKTNAAGWYYDIRGGLHSAEIRLLGRALREHLQTATKRKQEIMRSQHAGKGGDKTHELANAQDSIDAIIRLGQRLREEVTPHNNDHEMRICWMTIAIARGIKAADQEMLDNMGWTNKAVIGWNTTKEKKGKGTA